MNASKLMLVIFTGVALCVAQTIDLRGVVRDKYGMGVANAKVTLKTASLSTTTMEDGSFVLSSTDIQYVWTATSNISTPVTFHNGEITITLSDKSLVTMRIHDFRGRKIYDKSNLYASGIHKFSLAIQSSGFYLYTISIGKKTFSYKVSKLGTFSTAHSVFYEGSSTPPMQRTVPDIRSDVITVAHDGYLNYSNIISNYTADDLEITLVKNAGNVTDADGNVYQSVKIGDQVWTIENLRTTKYNDGTSIQKSVESDDWKGNFATQTGAYCYYENDSAANAELYGALYNWFAVNTGKLAPSGWHVPTIEEWKKLETYLISNDYNWDGSSSGNKIAKSLASKSGWVYSGSNGTVGNNQEQNNCSNFSGLPGGYRVGFGFFADQGKDCNWWSASDSSSDENRAFNRYIRNHAENLFEGLSAKVAGYSVRLVRD